MIYDTFALRMTVKPAIVNIATYWGRLRKTKIIQYAYLFKVFTELGLWSPFMFSEETAHDRNHS